MANSKATEKVRLQMQNLEEWVKSEMNGKDDYSRGYYKATTQCLHHVIILSTLNKLLFYHHKNSQNHRTLNRKSRNDTTGLEQNTCAEKRKNERWKIQLIDDKVDIRTARTQNQSGKLQNF